MAKKFYRVHLGAYYTADVVVEAENEEEAIDKARYADAEYEYADQMGTPDAEEIDENEYNEWIDPTTAYAVGSLRSKCVSIYHDLNTQLCDGIINLIKATKKDTYCFFSENDVEDGTEGYYLSPSVICTDDDGLPIATHIKCLRLHDTEGCRAICVDSDNTYQFDMRLYDLTIDELVNLFQQMEHPDVD